MKNGCIQTIFFLFPLFPCPNISSIKEICPKFVSKGGQNGRFLQFVYTDVYHAFRRYGPDWEYAAVFGFDHQPPRRIPRTGRQTRLFDWFFRTGRFRVCRRTFFERHGHFPARFPNRGRHHAVHRRSANGVRRRTQGKIHRRTRSGNNRRCDFPPCSAFDCRPRNDCVDYSADELA